MSGIVVILGVACVILIWIAHAIHKNAEIEQTHKIEQLSQARDKIEQLSQERDKYATEAGYKLSLDLKYEKKQHIYEIAEKRHDFVVREYNKLNSELSAIRTKICDSKEEQDRCRQTLLKLDEEIEQKRKEIENVWNEIEEWVQNRIALAKERMLQEREDDLNLKIATAWADYKMIIWEKAVDGLLRKPHPISFAKAREYERQIADFKDKILVDYKNIEYQYNYLISLFPELQEYIDGTAVKESNIEEDVEYEDRRKAYIPLDEWEQLSESAKSQLALDRYNERRRLTNAQVGRDYEEYVAFLFRNRCKGAKIDMYGEQKGLADLGRDLIVKYSGKVYIVQCKRWSQDRVIREKHIMQLFGTTIEYCWEMKKKDIHPLDVIGKSVIPVFVTTTELSPTANRFAERLGVVVHKVPMGDYPQIKCNIGKEGERIYHLPFDQQYNSTLIEHQKGEFMAWTVEEAEKNGFRRALRHYIS